MNEEDIVAAQFAASVSRSANEVDSRMIQGDRVNKINPRDFIPDAPATNRPAETTLQIKIPGMITAPKSRAIHSGHGRGPELPPPEVVPANIPAMIPLPADIPAEVLRAAAGDDLGGTAAAGPPPPPPPPVPAAEQDPNQLELGLYDPITCGKIYDEVLVLRDELREIKAILAKSKKG